MTQLTMASPEIVDYHSNVTVELDSASVDKAHRLPCRLHGLAVRICSPTYAGVVTLMHKLQASEDAR
jgi:hypothetical protein